MFFVVLSVLFRCCVWVRVSGSLFRGFWVPEPQSDAAGSIQTLFATFHRNSTNHRKGLLFRSQKAPRAAPEMQKGDLETRTKTKRFRGLIWEAFGRVLGSIWKPFGGSFGEFSV